MGDESKFEVKPHGSPEPAKAVLTLLTRPSKGKILIVESDPDLARMLEVRLARDGHEVIVATSGDAALRAATDEQIDVALIDQVPDEVPVLDILSSLQQRGSQFEGIVVTASASTEFILKALNAGAFDVVSKPIPDLKIVLHKVKKALAKVLAERDRHELARLLHAQTQDIARREVPVSRTLLQAYANLLSTLAESYVRASHAAILDRQRYAEILGLKLTYRFDDKFATLEAGRNLLLALHPKTPNTPDPGAKGSVTLGLVVDERIDTVVSRLAERGVRVTGRSEPGRSIDIEDLDGNVIGRFGSERSHDPGKFWGPHGIWTDSAGDLYVAEVLEGARLQKFARRK